MIYHTVDTKLTWESAPEMASVSNINSYKATNCTYHINPQPFPDCQTLITGTNILSPARCQVKNTGIQPGYLACDYTYTNTTKTTVVLHAILVCQRCDDPDDTQTGYMVWTWTGSIPQVYQSRNSKLSTMELETIYYNTGFENDHLTWYHNSNWRPTSLNDSLIFIFFGLVGLASLITGIICIIAIFCPPTDSELETLQESP